MENITRVEGLVINAPEFFRDPQFVDWLNRDDTVVMTWHSKGERPGEWSDTVVLVDPQLQGEGAESDMPEHIWKQIVKACIDEGLTGQLAHIPVRLTNIE